MKPTFLLLSFAAVLAGCGTGGDNVEVHPVQGTVNYKGKPMVGGGSIAFIPLSSQPGKAPGGFIKEDGTYVLTTYKEGDGSMTGEFRVVITQTTVQEPENTGDSDAGGGIEPIIVVEKADQIPAIYSDASRSPLKATIEAKSNVIDFELEENPSPAKK